MRVPTVCLVCGHNANCLHYGAASCKSCKIFFRRFVLAGREILCYSGGKCDLSYGFAFCRACRYRKCIDVGMTPEAVTRENDASAGRADLKIAKTVRPKCKWLEIDLNHLLYVEEKISKLLHSTYYPYAPTKTIDDFLGNPSALNSCSRYQEVTSWSTQGEPPDKVAHDHLRRFVFGKTILAVEYYKTFPFFRALDDCDQRALMNATLRQICLFHTAYDAFFRGHTEFAVDLDGNLMFDLPYFRGEVFDKLHKTMCVSACAENKITLEKAVLLKAIIALNHGAAELSAEAREIVADERLKHVNALMTQIRSESTAEKWLFDFMRVYDIVNRNVRATACMAELFFSKVFPLVCSRPARTKQEMWLKLFIE